MRVEQQAYRMTFTVGGLFVNESLETARLHEPGRPWEATLLQAQDAGIMHLPKVSSRRRMLREVVARLAVLGPEEFAFLRNGADRSEQQALLWLASCRLYRFVGQFAFEVLQERFQAQRFDLPLESFDLFFEAKAEWHDGLAGISRSTRLKLRQVLFRMMREAGLLTDRNVLQHADLSPRVIHLIKTCNRGELRFFPGLAEAGGWS